MTVGVAIVTHNNGRTIAECIASVRGEGVTHIEVVDSASIDDTGNILENMQQPYVVLPMNQGFAHAANKAAGILNTDYVLFLNPDAAFTAGTITELVTTIQKSPRIGIVGGLLISDAGIAEADAYGDEPTLWNMVTRHISRKKSINTMCKVDWVSGGSLLIKKSVFEQVGGFDESFFLYWEDIDLCRRVRDAGFSVVINKKARVIHHRGASSNNNQEKTRLYDVSANRYFQKHSPLYIWYLQLLLRNMYRLLRPLAR